MCVLSFYKLEVEKKIEGKKCIVKLEVMDHNKYVILEGICYQIAQKVLSCVPRQKNRRTNTFQ